MDDLQQIAAVVVVCGVGFFFALMAWAGLHQS
jgi:hypothetical protein